MIASIIIVILKEKEQPRKRGAAESPSALALKAAVPRLNQTAVLYARTDTDTHAHMRTHRFEINLAVLRRQKRQQRA